MLTLSCVMTGRGCAVAGGGRGLFAKAVEVWLNWFALPSSPFGRSCFSFCCFPGSPPVCLLKDSSASLQSERSYVLLNLHLWTLSLLWVHNVAVVLGGATVSKQRLSVGFRL